MTRRLHRTAAATLVVVAACSTQRSAAPPTASPSLPPAPSTVEPTAAPGDPGGADSGAGDLESPVACDSQLFDAAPGHHDRFAFETEAGLTGFKNAAGDVVIEPRFGFAYEFFPTGITGAVLDGRFVFIDTKGQVVADAFPFDNGPDYFVAGRARIVAEGKVGFIDKHGKVVVRPQFDFASSFCEERAVVCNGCREVGAGEHKDLAGGEWGYIDRSGALVIPMRYESASGFEGGKAEVVERGKTIIIGPNGVVLGDVKDE